MSRAEVFRGNASRDDLVFIRFLFNEGAFLSISGRDFLLYNTLEIKS